MKCGYIRLSKAGPTLKSQQDALRASGIDDFSEYGPVYVDEVSKRRSDATLSQRSKAIKSLKAGDQLVVANAARLGLSMSDVLDVLQDVAARGAVVFDAETGAVVQWHPDALVVLEFARRAESGNRKEIASKMKAARIETGKLGGAPEKLAGTALTEAKKLWDNPSLSVAEIADKIGVSKRTLYRRLGDRGGKQFGSN